LQRERRLSCAGLVAAPRQFRRYLQTSDWITVTLVPVGDRPDRPPSVARGAKRQWEIYEQTLGDVDVLIDDEQVRNDQLVMQRSLYAVIRARAEYPAGAGQWRHGLRYPRYRAELRPDDVPTLPDNGEDP
jgi:hypothetical protein